MPADKVSFYNQIDMGIFLCFLELCLIHEGISYEAELKHDAGSDDEKTLFAVYKLQDTCRCAKKEVLYGRIIETS